MELIDITDVKRSRVRLQSGLLIWTDTMHNYSGLVSGCT